METQQVLDALKPKAASYGFSEEELREASENIAKLHPEEATQEEVDKVVDNHLPFLKLSQSAANRSYERLKAQFEKDHPTKTKEEEEAERKAKEEAARKAKEEEERRKEAEKKEPEWFKQYKADQEKRISELESENKRLVSERTDSTLREKAIAALEGVDESYYGLMLKGKKFEKQDDVDSFVAEVKEGWEAMSKKLKIGSLTSVRPPKTGTPTGDNKPSEAVNARIERRKKAGQPGASIRGLEPKK